MTNFDRSKAAEFTHISLSLYHLIFPMDSVNFPKYLYMTMTIKYKKIYLMLLNCIFAF